jgi:hypothetical protein
MNWQVYSGDQPMGEPVQAPSAKWAVEIVRRKMGLWGFGKLHARPARVKMLRPPGGNPRRCSNPNCGYCDPADMISDICPSCDEPRDF